VAALTLIDSVQFPKLFSIIFGEGMVNDAVAIILFKVVGGIFDKIGDNPMDGGEIAGTIIGNFVLTIVASVGIGLAAGNWYLT
jgi:NhaP-type Na+/H+ or K+/H+ antiporter